jgi:hypothetical protein
MTLRERAAANRMKIEFHERCNPMLAGFILLLGKSWHATAAAQRDLLVFAAGQYR